MSRFLCVSDCAIKHTVLFCVSDSHCNTVNQPLPLPVTRTLTQAHWGLIIFRSEEHMEAESQNQRVSEQPTDLSSNVLPP